MGSLRKNILMLGWEFPPAFTGGLGVACYNIVKSLSDKVNIHLIVPHVEGPSDMENVTLTGVNKSQLHFESINSADHFNFNLSKIPVALSAYPSIRKARARTSHVIEVQTSAYWNDLPAVFQDRNLYGHDMGYRIEVFATAALHLSLLKPFDIIHAHDWPTFRAALLIKQETQKPLVLHIHSLETDRSGSQTRNDIYEIEKSAMEQADVIMAVSQYTKTQIVQEYSIEPTKITVAHNGAEPAEKSTFRKKVNEKWITFVGRITFQKGPRFVVQTAHKLVKISPEARFVVVGMGDQFEDLVSEVARLRLGKYFIFTGMISREEVRDLLACSDAYFMPSVSEPFGLSAMEAVQQGAASVLSSRSGAAEVLVNALSAEFWDTDKFANYLHALITYPKLQKEISEKSLNDIVALTWENTADHIVNTYETLLTS